jgi:hypothetical protein
MDGSFAQSRETGAGIHRRRGIGFFALPGLVVIALIGLAITQPATTRWIAALAERAAAKLVSEFAPRQVAQPTGKARPVKACRLIRA